MKQKLLFILRLTELFKKHIPFQNNNYYLIMTFTKSNNNAFYKKLQ